MFAIGELVFDASEEIFAGIGKIISLSEEANTAEVGFFRSPLEASSDSVIVPISALAHLKLYDERLVYCKNPRTGYWQRARYGGARPNGDHLVIFRSGDQMVVGIEEIYIPCVDAGRAPDPIAYLKARATDSPFFSEWRDPFLNAYIDQRGRCRSIGSIPSSSIQLEKHQLAVVRRVLQDYKKRYLLADEVGLGKTIEAALVLREQLLLGGPDTKAVVAAPAALTEQWREELEGRFHLGAMLGRNLYICTHEALPVTASEINPEILVIDEVHQLAPWACSDSVDLRNVFVEIAGAAQAAETCLILSGTPVLGNERNFLAMLHLLSPDEYKLDQQGIEDFKTRINERERLGGIYQAFVPENDNGTLEDLLDQLVDMFPDDQELVDLANALRPYVDFLANPNGQERERLIRELRKHIGENYRLHQRMLRNRREDPSVAHLFPGLAGVTAIEYHPGDEPYSVEQYLEEFRGLQQPGCWQSQLVNEEDFVGLLSAALTSPSTLASALARNEQSHSDGLTEIDLSLLGSIRRLTALEQTAKDQALVQACESIWKETPNARIVVFCGEVEVADHAYELLINSIDQEVERHTRNSPLRFVSDDSVAVLVCDRNGEDGLNLNGGKKVAIHYDLPFDVARIEQRLGRLNRYSAAIFAAPVRSVLLVPLNGVYSQRWRALLDGGIRIFDRSVASLQHVLESAIQKMLGRVAEVGPTAIAELKTRLEGPTGLVVTESGRVRVQEELNRLDEDISLAAEFAEQLERADEIAERHVEAMMDWVTRALMFEKVRGEFDGTFRFRYSTGADTNRRTLMDVVSFLNYCYPALERAQVDPSRPVTVLMSASREVASHGRHIHPMRFGSPFVEHIFRFMADDPRGIATALLRYSTRSVFEEPTPFLGLTLLVSLTSGGESPELFRRLDEEFRPRVVKLWLDGNGVLVNDSRIIELLEHPYNKDLSKYGYQDKNIRSEIWAHLEEYFPMRLWSQMIDGMTKQVHSYVMEAIPEVQITRGDRLSVDCLSTKFIVAVSG